MNILSRKQTKTEVYLPSNKLEPNHVQCIERYLDAVRSDILFAKSVILVEGDAELILIPALVKSTLGISLDEMGISLIKMDGTVFKHISDLFHKERIRSYCAILTDLDEAFATETNDTFATDDFVKSQMNADKSGKERKKALDMYIGDNPYVKAFYAQNTFETELVKFDQNSELFTEVMDSNYKKGKHLNNVKSEIEDNDLCVRYNRALKFAKKIGKGWLATQMVEHTHVDNLLPDYILQAIKFSLTGRNLDDICLKMMEFNLELMKAKEKAAVDKEDSFESKLTVYKSFYADDTFVRFVEI